MSGASEQETRRAQVRWSAASSALVVILNLSVMNVAFADLRSSFPGTRLGTLGWVVSAYTFCSAQCSCWPADSPIESVVVRCT